MADTIQVADGPQTEKVETARLRRWQWISLALMFLGYAGYYMCRVNFSVATPLLIKTFGGQGVDKQMIGRIASIGTLLYAAGKFINGSVVDFLGGRRMFLLGMGGAIIFTVFFGLSSAIPLFTLAWGLNRFVQSTGWAGMVRITSRWFGYSSYAKAMGVLSLSFLLGDMIWRLVLGRLIDYGVDWRGLFFVSAGTLGVIFVAVLILLKESPRQIGEAEPPTNPANLFGTAGPEERPGNLGDLLAPLLRSPLFWAVCALSFGFTLLRDTFGNWGPLYLTEAAHMSKGQAGSASAIFPFCGAISTLLCGYFGDRLGLNGRAILIFCGLTLSIPALLALGNGYFGHSPTTSIMLLGAVAFCILGPYSFLAGVIALDFGGKRGSATASGWIDGVGYLAGYISGEGVGALAEKSGWSTAFSTLAAITVLSCVAAVVYGIMQRNGGRQRPIAGLDDTI